MADRPLSSVLGPSTILPSRLKVVLPKGSEFLLPIVKALPQSAGTIRKIFSPEKISGRVVIHIQDVHRNLEAQINISKAVQELIDQKKVDLVALEGAFGPMNFSWYRKYPYQDSVKAVADYLSREKRISGPVHTAFISSTEIPPFIGVDQQEHYDANVEAYRRAAPLVASYKKKLERDVRTLDEAKAAAFNARLKEFDDMVAAYRKGSLPWGEYVRRLSTYTEDLSPKVEAYLTALEMERTLNFTLVESERTQLIAQLTTKLNKVETDELLSASAAYRAGQLTHSDFYAHLKELCARKGVDLAHTPAMNEYIRYVLLSDSLDVDTILQEAASVEKQIYDTLVKTEKERRLIEDSRHLHLVGKLLDFALTKEEWAEYKNTGKTFSLDLSSFESFYLEAEARDRAMAENLEKAMDASHSKVAVLVTGGFHSEGILEQLQPKGFTVVSYVPKISKIEDANGSAYLSVFTQEKTPLDKLFAGEKLFLAEKQGIPFSLGQALVRLRRTIGLDGTASSESRNEARLTMTVSRGIITAVVAVATGLTLRVALVKMILLWSPAPGYLIGGASLMAIIGIALLLHAHRTHPNYFFRSGFLGGFGSAFVAAGIALVWSVGPIGVPLLLLAGVAIEFSEGQEETGDLALSVRIRDLRRRIIERHDSGGNETETRFLKWLGRLVNIIDAESPDYTDLNELWGVKEDLFKVFSSDAKSFLGDIKSFELKQSFDLAYSHNPKQVSLHLMEALTLFTMENRSEIDEPTLSCLGEVIEIFRNKNLISTYASRRILRLLAISPYVPTSVYRKFMHGNDDPILNAFVTGLHLIDVFNLEDSLDMESVLTPQGTSVIERLISIVNTKSDPIKSDTAERALGVLMLGLSQSLRDDFVKTRIMINPLMVEHELEFLDMKAVLIGLIEQPNNWPVLERCYQKILNEFWILGGGAPDIAANLDGVEARAIVAAGAEKTWVARTRNHLFLLFDALPDWNRKWGDPVPLDELFLDPPTKHQAFLATIRPNYGGERTVHLLVDFRNALDQHQPKAEQSATNDDKEAFVFKKILTPDFLDVLKRHNGGREIKQLGIVDLKCTTTQEVTSARERLRGLASMLHGKNLAAFAYRIEAEHWVAYRLLVDPEEKIKRLLVDGPSSWGGLFPLVNGSQKKHAFEVDVIVVPDVSDKHVHIANVSFSSSLKDELAGAEQEKIISGALRTLAAWLEENYPRYMVSVFPLGTVKPYFSNVLRELFDAYERKIPAGRSGESLRGIFIAADPIFEKSLFIGMVGDHGSDADDEVAKKQKEMFNSARKLMKVTNHPEKGFLDVRIRFDKKSAAQMMAIDQNVDDALQNVSAELDEAVGKINSATPSDMAFQKFIPLLKKGLTTSDPKTRAAAIRVFSAAPRSLAKHVVDAVLGLGDELNVTSYGLVKAPRNALDENYYSTRFRDLVLPNRQAVAYVLSHQPFPDYTERLFAWIRDSRNGDDPTGKNAHDYNQHYLYFDDFTDIRDNAAIALGKLSSENPEITDRLLALISPNDPSPWWVKHAALKALMVSGVTTPEVEQDLQAFKRIVLERLRMKPVHSEETIDTLALFKDRDLAPLFVRIALNRTYEASVRVRALQALEAIDPHDPLFIKLLAKLWNKSRNIDELLDAPKYDPTIGEPAAFIIYVGEMLTFAAKNHNEREPLFSTETTQEAAIEMLIKHGPEKFSQTTDYWDQGIDRLEWKHMGPALQRRLVKNPEDRASIDFLKDLWKRLERYKDTSYINTRDGDLEELPLLIAALPFYEQDFIFGVIGMAELFDGATIRVFTGKFFSEFQAWVSRRTFTKFGERFFREEKSRESPPAASSLATFRIYLRANEILQEKWGISREAIESQWYWKLLRDFVAEICLAFWAEAGEVNDRTEFWEAHGGDKQTLAERISRRIGMGLLYAGQAGIPFALTTAYFGYVGTGIVLMIAFSISTLAWSYRTSHKDRAPPLLLRAAVVPAAFGEMSAHLAYNLFAFLFWNPWPRLIAPLAAGKNSVSILDSGFLNAVPSDEPSAEEVQESATKLGTLRELRELEADFGFLDDAHPAARLVQARLRRMLPMIKNPADLPRGVVLAKTGRGIDAAVYENGTIVILDGFSSTIVVPESYLHVPRQTDAFQLGAPRAIHRGKRFHQTQRRIARET